MTRSIKYFGSIASFCFGAFATWLFMYLVGGEWKPVGDGRSVVNTRTGETQFADSGLPTLKAIEGKWFRDFSKDGKKQRTGLIITPESITIAASWTVDEFTTRISRVVEAGEGWYVIELAGNTTDVNYTSSGGVSSVKQRPVVYTQHIEIVDDSHILYDGETYSRLTDSPDSKAEWWKP